VETKKSKWLLPTVISPPDTICVEIEIPNDDGHIRAFWGAINELAMAWNWEESYDAGSDVAYVWNSAIELAVEKVRTGVNCMPYLLRMSVSDVCQVEQSTNGGASWTDAFNLKDCIELAVRPLFDDLNDLVTVTAENLLQELLDKWDGSVGSISTSVIYDGSGDDDFRDFALCNILQLLVPAMCEAEIAKRAAQADVWSDIGDVLRAVGEVAFAFGYPYVTIAAGIASAVVEFGSAAWVAVSTEALDNAAAQENVACCMYNEMQGGTPSQSSFASALDGCDFTFGTFEAQIAGAISPMLVSLEFFLAFLDLWGKFYPYAKAGILDTCVCGFDWCHTFDFTIDDGGWIIDETSEAAGEWSIDVGWEDEDITVPVQNERRRTINIVRDFGITTTLNQMTVTYDFTLGNYSDNAASLKFISEVAAVPTDELEILKDDQPQGTAIVTRWTDTGGVSADAIRLFLRTSKDISQPFQFSGDTTVKRIKLCGTGTEPTW